MDRSRLAAHKLGNAIQSLLLVGTLALLLGTIAWVLGGADLALGALGGVGILYLVNPVTSPRLVMSLYRARPLTPWQAPELYDLLAELARRADLPRTPRLYYLPSRTLNAFATGTREDASIAVSDGLLRGLNLRGLTGVLAHEVTHIANGDLQVMAFADVVTRVASTLSLLGQILLVVTLPLSLLAGMEFPWLALLLLLAAPTLSALVQFALSRNREFDADLGAAELTGDPAGLAAALERLERVQGGLWERLFLPGRRQPDPSLLRTHPETSERIARLLDLAAHRPTRTSLAPVGARGQAADPLLLDWSVPAPPRRYLFGQWY